MTVLLTGFEPFDGASTNSSWEAVSRVSDIPSLVTAVLPVEFGRASEMMRELIDLHSPDIVIAVGLAEDRTLVTPERVAINVADARIPDNGGVQPRDIPIDAEGPAAYFTRLPVKAITAALMAEQIPSAVSDTAGTFVCNSVMYTLLQDTAASGIPAGFIHVPSHLTMPVEMIATALSIAVRATLSDGSVAANDY